MRRLLRTALLVGAGLLLAACFSGPSVVRTAQGGACESDRDCLFGLVCRGAGVNQPGPRSCVYEQYGKCKESSDCLAGHLCREGICTVECVQDSECGNVELRRCYVGECRDRKERGCLAPSDCPLGQDCSAGVCVERMRMRCYTDSDCPPGERCLASVCR